MTIASEGFLCISAFHAEDETNTDLEKQWWLFRRIHHDKISLSGNVCSTRLVLLIIHSSSSLQMISEIWNYSSLLSYVITTTKHNLIRRQQGCILIVLINYATLLHLPLGLSKKSVWYCVFLLLKKKYKKFQFSLTKEMGTYLKNYMSCWMTVFIRNQDILSFTLDGFLL